MAAHSEEDDGEALALETFHLAMGPFFGAVKRPEPNAKILECEEILALEKEQLILESGKTQGI